MIIATYRSAHPDLPESRRWLAQIEKIKGRFYVCFHGSTEQEAYNKAKTFVEGGTKPAPAPAPAADPMEDLF